MVFYSFNLVVKAKYFFEKEIIIIMHDIFAKRTIKFPYDKSDILLRRGIISHDQISEKTDIVAIDNITFAIAKRMLPYTHLTVVNCGNDVYVRSGDEDALDKAFTDAPIVNTTVYDDITETIKEDIHIENKNSDKEITNETSNEEIEEVIEIPDAEPEESVETESNVSENEEEGNTISDEENEVEEIKEEAHEEVASVVRRVPQPNNNNHHSKKHHK